MFFLIPTRTSSMEALVTQQKKLQVRFNTKPDLDNGLNKIAKEAQFPTVESCFDIKELKMTMIGGFATIAIKQGCCDEFMALFKKSDSFVSVAPL